jgi:hypothetical protein
MVYHNQVLVDPSSITIMIHMTLCAFDELMLIILCNVHFYLAQILCKCDTTMPPLFAMSIICLGERLASTLLQDIFPVSHLAKLISSLINLSFKHQKPLGGLDALSISSFLVIDDNTIKAS